MKTPPIVEVRWKDAVTWKEEWTLDEAPREARIVERTTVGYLMHQTEELVAVAHTFDGDGGSDVTCIPTPWVTALIKKRR